MRRIAFIVLLLPYCARADIHDFHRQKLGTLTCSLCHVPEARGSIQLKRPGHEQCRTCHSAAFQSDSKSPICAECHDASGLRPFPGTRNILAGFSHARHVDSKARVDAASGVRADCAFCHQPRDPKQPSHVQCAACHSRPGIRPRLSASITASDCLGCHTPGEKGAEPPLERFRTIHFSHADHSADCLVCHRGVLRSNNLAAVTMPAMADCVSCHKTSNCATCHADRIARDRVKPSSHTAGFRVHHEAEASAAGAKCFACHQNVAASAQARDQCTECHQVMRPLSHTARWKEVLHGQYAAIDRSSCTVCHTADSCIRCHNELPRSHVPLPMFKAGGHARLAMLDQRACMTCHTYQNTCAECHTRL